MKMIRESHTPSAIYRRPEHGQPVWNDSPCDQVFVEFLSISQNWFVFFLGLCDTPSNAVIFRLRHIFKRACIVWFRECQKCVILCGLPGCADRVVRARQLRFRSVRVCRQSTAFKFQSCKSAVKLMGQLSFRQALDTWKIAANALDIPKNSSCYEWNWKYVTLFVEESKWEEFLFYKVNVKLSDWKNYRSRKETWLNWQT